MRFNYLGLMATFWVLSAQGEDGGQQDKKTGIQVEPFGTTINSFVSIGASNFQFNITTTSGHAANTTLYLCQTTLNSSTGTTNTSASRMGYFSVNDAAGDNKESTASSSTTSGTTAITNERLTPLPFALSQGNTNNSLFYLCFTNSEGTCASASKAVNFPGQDVQIPSLNTEDTTFKPSEKHSETNPQVYLIGGVPPPSASTTFALTVVATPQPTPSSPAVEATDTPTPSPNTGLSTGAKAGIAVGALGVAVIILLAALLCLRKRHRRASAPDQIMLNQSSADSHDLITEKEVERSSPQSYEAPTPVYGANLNVSPKSQTRHSALSPYEEIPSQPYTGSAAAIPRRKPTLSAKSTSASSSTNKAAAATVGVATTGAIASSSTTPPTISREVSAASTIGPPSRTTPPTTNDTSPPTSRNFEEYRDVPTTYADRHTPQVFEGGLQAPFLGSESNVSRQSMSEADLARLTEEEEERRIDAAIEEAERKRRP